MVGPVQIEHDRGGWRRQRPGDLYWALVPCDHEGCDKKSTVRVTVAREVQHWCGRHAKAALR